MSIRYALLILTNARPYCLERLLNSVGQLTPPPSEIIVGNGTSANAPDWVTAWYGTLAKRPDIRTIHLRESEGPAASRHDLIKTCTADYAMLLDDDGVLTPSSSRLLTGIASAHCDILGGVLLQNRDSDYENLRSFEAARTCLAADPEDYGQRTICIGFTYSMSQQRDGLGCVIKTPVYCPATFEGIIPIDDISPNIIASMSILSSLRFDPQFEYYFDWYDFYMQARTMGLRAATDTGARFLHLPEKYAAFNAARLCPREQDKARFYRKWKIHPLFSGETAV
jgi:glycosyltransferase involved in cell wall biosynthesis